MTTMMAMKEKYILLMVLSSSSFQKGVVRGTQLALDYMGKHKGGEGGTVLNIASVAGLGTKTACPVYDGTKFFVVGYSMSISVSFKEQFLRI